MPRDGAPAREDGHAVVFALASGAPADAIRGWVASRGLRLRSPATTAAVVAATTRARPRVVLLDGREGLREALELTAALKQDAYSAVVPTIIIVSDQSPGAVEAAFAAGADEVLVDAAGGAGDWAARLDAALARSDRDLGVHPSTRLPGAPRIEAEYRRRISTDARFAVCYVDLDHFKEFNDRYGYNHGDRVILILSRILREVVRAHAPSAFVGHIGGDDFIFNAPFDEFRTCCEDVLAVFNELIPLQYTEEDRERGYFMGKDRRGVLYQVPLMTLSIGVVTNEQRRFTHTAQISELATEMKAYAKTFAGSIYVVDRRSDGPWKQD